MEPPQGVRANMLRTYGDLSPAFLAAEEHSTDKGREWRGLVFACAFFHALLQVRRWSDQLREWHVLSGPCQMRLYLAFTLSLNFHLAGAAQVWASGLEHPLRLCHR